MEDPGAVFISSGEVWSEDSQFFSFNRQSAVMKQILSYLCFDFVEYLKRFKLIMFVIMFKMI